MAILTAVFWFALGAIVGSFLNVVVYRLPAGLSVVTPGSHCPACRRPIRWFDNVPIFAWLWLRGRCRDCAAPIAMRYPMVEFSTAVLFLSIGWPHTAACLPGVAEVGPRSGQAHRWASAAPAGAAPTDSPSAVPPSADILPPDSSPAKSGPAEPPLAQSPAQGVAEKAPADVRGAAAVAMVHLLLLSTLWAAALIAYDGGPTPRRLFLPAWIVVPLAYAPEWGQSAAVYAGLGPWRAYQPVLGALVGVLGGWVVEITMRFCSAAPEGEAAQSSPNLSAERAAESFSAQLLSVVFASKSSRRGSPAWALGCLGVALGWTLTLAVGGVALAAALVAWAIRRRDGRAMFACWSVAIFLFAWAWLLAAAWRLC